MNHQKDKTTPACPSKDYYSVVIDGKVRRIARDHRQPGGQLLDPEKRSVVQGFIRAADEIRKRDANRD